MMHSYKNKQQGMAVWIVVILLAVVGVVAYVVGQSGNQNDMMSEMNTNSNEQEQENEVSTENPPAESSQSGSWIMTSGTDFQVLYYSEWTVEPYMYGSPAMMSQGNASQVGWKFTLPSGSQITYGGPQSSCLEQGFIENEITMACVNSWRSELTGMNLTQPDYSAFAEFVAQNS